MNVVIKSSYSRLTQWAANYIAKTISDFAPTSTKPFVLGLPTGSTPLGVYQELVSLHKQGKLSFEHVISFNMDEYVGLPLQHPQSYHYFMQKHFFQYIDILPQNIYIPNGMAKDLQQECQLYEEKILKKGPIHLFLAGLGSNGHLAFNEPGSSLSSKTRMKTLAKETIYSNAVFFDNPKNVPHKTLTVGIQTVMNANEVLLLASGYKKALAIQKVIEDSISHMYPASMLQMHQNSTVACDLQAAFELKLKTVEYFYRLERTQGTLSKEAANFSLEEFMHFDSLK